MFWKMSSFHGLRASPILTALAVLALSALLSIPVQAHQPSEVGLSYDLENQTLDVAVLHKVSSPTGHYVVQVDIFKNDEKILSNDYTSQPAASDPFTYSYAVNECHIRRCAESHRILQHRREQEWRADGWGE